MTEPEQGIFTNTASSTMPEATESESSEYVVQQPPHRY